MIDIILQKLSEPVLSKFKLWCDAVKAYYDTEEGEEPIMSDAEFDLLQDELLSYNINDLTTFINESIYRNGKFERKHDDYVQEMISLKKIHVGRDNVLSEISNFFSNNQEELFIAPKFDGCSLKITWDHTNNTNNTDNTSRIVQIITRGGIDVTRHFKNHPDIIATKCYNKKIITGELLITKQLFMEKYSSEVGGDYENPRNFVGGLVKKNDLSSEIINDLSFVPCTDGINPLRFVKLHNRFIWLPANNISIEMLTGYFNAFKSESFPFLCDGLVIGFSEPNNIRRVKDNYPLNMIAIKFPAPKVQTEVIGFDWTQKKSGKLTPRLMLKPVKLDGSTVSFANGYNIERVIENGIGVGSIVEIMKSGDIIPIVVKTIKRSTNIEYPKCEYKRIGKHLIAINNEESKRFKFISGLKLLQLQGIGDILADQIGMVVEYDILKVFDKDFKPFIVKQIGSGASWQNFSEIYNIKTLHLDELINILQFDNVGPKISKKVANLILKLSNDTSNISSDVLCNVCRGDGFQKIKDSIQILKQYGVQVIKPVVINEDTITFEMSGSPVGMSKSEFENKLKKIYPNAIHTSLTKETKYLFVDNVKSNTSKALKARKYNIKIVSYEDALNGKI